MKIHPKRGLCLLPLNRLLCFALALVFFFGFTFSTLRLRGDFQFKPKLVTPRPSPVVEAVSGESPGVSVRETVLFPDQALVFLNYPSPVPLFTKDDIDCVYFRPNSSEPDLKLPPASVDGENPDRQFVRCPTPPRGSTVSVAVKNNGHLPAGTIHRWDRLVYEAVIDRDGSTVVFVKGLNLRGGKLADPSRFKCFYGWDFTNPKLHFRSEALSVGQEIVRCRTPLSILSGTHSNLNGSIKVSVKVSGKPLLSSVARLVHRLEPHPRTGKQHQMCICTMVRNQARFLREWVTYHARIGVERWFIYDNNSDDEISGLIDLLTYADFNISRHVWPWIKTQEAGFSHCALQNRDTCEWIGFIDVDEFLYVPSGLMLHDIIRNYSGMTNVVELRVACHSFGPSGLNKVPTNGVTVGYTCRMVLPERHKSIVRPEALNSTLINLVHHFHLKSGLRHVNVDRTDMVINHYKYQVWEVFKEKFYRRVATYVSDWQKKQNVGSKDRAPGLGTMPVEPPDWSSRFCEVVDTGLRDRVVDMFTDPVTGLLPWLKQDESEDAALAEN